jgi:hypothetical protein
MTGILTGLSVLAAALLVMTLIEAHDAYRQRCASVLAII